MTSSTRQVFIVIDDHESVLGGTVAALKQHYPEANILEAQTSQTAQELVSTANPDLVFTDLSIPDASDGKAQIEVGLDLLRTLMQDYPTLNILVQSAHTRSLVRLKSAIASHKGGFAIVDKSLPMRDMLKRVSLVLDGGSFTPPEIRAGIEIKPEWLEVLVLAFQEGLQDKTIAQRMNVAERTVRHYWTKIQDVLGVYPEDSEGLNIRIQTELRARQEGLID
jgi:DNA-binding NarL/FixJ family response regulator